MSRPAIVLVEWLDSHRASNGWTELDESVESGREAITTAMLSAGFLVHDDEDGVVVACGLNPRGPDVEGAMAIPRVAILKVTQLRGAAA
jgi:hypothetical protein